MFDLSHPPLLRNRCYINGKWIAAESGRTFPVHDPAGGEVIAEVPDMGAAETQAALDAAAEAQIPWSSLLAGERAGYLHRWQALMLEHQEDLARLMSTEQGKPLAEAHGEITYAASFLAWFADQARRVAGEIIAPHQTDKRLLVLREPVGVCVAITPWNFPAAMITRKVAPALAAGCTMLVKPAEQTPLSALALAALAEEAGLPPGVLGVVTGDAEAIGRAMTSHPAVRHLSFTGSTEVGRELMRQCADRVIRVALELGGNAPFIVFDDADLDAAVAGAMLSKYRNAGQTCVCCNRIYVQSGVYEAFADKFVAAVRQLRVGPGLAPDSTQGPLIDRAAVAKVSAHIEDALAQGGEVLCGGAPHELGGNFFTPTVIGGATAQMRVAREETFGPLAPLFRFDDEADAIRQANATEYGLAAYFYTTDLNRCWRVGEALEYGIVGVNTGIISNEVAPFGGVKQSGIGREGSIHGIDEYLELKYLCIGEVT